VLYAKKASYLTSNRFGQSSINLYQKIDSIKAFLIASTDKIPLEKAKQISLSDVQGVNDNASLRNVFENSSNEFSLQALEREIYAYNELVAELFPGNQEKLIAINQLQFRNTILSVVLYQLSQVQWQVVSSENSYLAALSD
jgi:hydroxylamine reductase (hybrid-cluster protein)